MLGTSPPQTTDTHDRVAWSAIGVVAVAAALCATVLWLSFVAIGDVALEVEQGDTVSEVGLPAVLLSSALAAAAGGALLRWWQSRSARATGHWTVVALVVAAISLLGPTTATTQTAMTSLIALHGVVAAVVIVGLRRSSTVALGSR